MTWTALIRDVEHYVRGILQQDFHWLIISASASLLLAGLMYLLFNKQKSTRSLSRFIKYCFPRQVYRHASSKLDLQFSISSLLLNGLLLTPWLVSSMAVANGVVDFLYLHMGAEQSLPNGDLWPSVCLTLSTVVAMDLGFYISHYLQHKLGFLWAFHKVHHSAVVLNPLTQFRQHPVDLLLDGTLIGIMTGMVIGVFAYAFMGVAEPLTVIGMNVFMFLFHLSGSLLRHSHIWVSWGIFNRILISPAQHQIHHSTALRHQDKNLGGMLAIWDALFGTLYLPRERETLSFGLKGGRPSSYTSIWQLYLEPVVEVTSGIYKRAHFLDPKNVAARWIPISSGIRSISKNIGGQ